MENILEVKNLKKSYGNKEVLKDISFSIKPGEIVGFIGPNGCGKTTTFKIITGLLKKNGGSIIVNGIDANKHINKALSNMSAIIEGPSLYLDMSGLANLKMQGKLRGASNEEIQEMVDFLGFEKSINKKVKTYSLGMKQKLQLCICLLAKPKLLLLDEPTNGLDPTGSLAFRKQVKDMAEKKGISVLISSHLLHELQETCDRFLFVKDGKIIERDVKTAFITYIIETHNGSNLANKLSSSDKFESVSLEADRVVVSFANRDSLNDLLAMVHESGVQVNKIYEQTENIESQYQEMYL